MRIKNMTKGKFIVGPQGHVLQPGAVSPDLDDKLAKKLCEAYPLQLVRVDASAEKQAAAAASEEGGELSPPSTAPAPMTKAQKAAATKAEKAKAAAAAKAEKEAEKEPKGDESEDQATG